MQRRLCRWLPPEFLVHKLIEEWGASGLIWLDGDKSELGRWVTLATNPIESMYVEGISQSKSSENPFNILRTLKPGHWTGWLSYEAGAWTEPNNPWRSSSMATLWIASHDPILKFDLHKKELWLEGVNQHRFDKTINYLNKLSKNSLEITESQFQKNIGIPIESWKWLTKKERYLEQIHQIKNLISEGDIFQANLTTCCETTIPKNVSIVDLYLRVKKFSPAPFGGLVIGSGLATNEAIISTSPERFIQVLPSGDIETRPIKGTRARCLEPNKDSEMAIELITSIKDRAENLMIVDLLRNDLGRVCQPGSIYVPQLMGIESYPHVHHLTSVIKGKLQKNKTWVDLLEAAWPGGSITGAPKLRACKRLYELEPIARGPYCGSLINIGWDGKFDSNILIRSLIVNGSTIKAHAGCGIVADSDPEKESEELNWKLMPLLNAMK